MRILCFCILAWLASGNVEIADAVDQSDHSPAAVARFIDLQMEARWRAEKLVPSKPCADHEYLRRVCLDLAGVIPTEQAVSDFLRDTDPDKRLAAVEQLLKTQTYARYSAATWSNLWIGRGKDADALVHRRFRDWLYLQFKANQSFDRIHTGRALTQSQWEIVRIICEMPDAYWS